MKASVLKRKIMIAFTKYYIAIVAFCVIVVIGGGYLLFMKDTMNDINEIGVADLQSREDQLVERTETLLRLQNLNERFAKITKEDLRQLDNVLPHQSEIPYLVIELKEFIKNNGLDVLSLDIGPLSTGSAVVDTANTPVKSLSIVVVIDGLDSYEGIKTFLNAMSNNLPLVELNSFTYTPAVSAYTLNLTTYYQ